MLKSNYSSAHLKILFDFCRTVSVGGIAFNLAFHASVIYMLLLRLDMDKDSDNLYKPEKDRF